MTENVINSFFLFQGSQKIQETGLNTTLIYSVRTRKPHQFQFPTDQIRKPTKSKG